LVELVCKIIQKKNFFPAVKDIITEDAFRQLILKNIKADIKNALNKDLVKIQEKIVQSLQIKENIYESL
jgi:hypothetical protein